MIEAMQAITVRTITFGTPRKKSPAPRASPCIIPIRTCPKMIVFVMALNSFWNLSSVVFENGERSQM